MKPDTKVHVSEIMGWVSVLSVAAVTAVPVILFGSIVSRVARNGEREK